MDEVKYSVKLADGTIFENLGLNGNNFISSEKVDASVFESNCSPVTISDGTNEEIHENMELVQVTQMGDEYWFILRDLPESELAQIKLRADVDYIAMMSEVEL